MSGSMYLYISAKKGVFKIPKPKNTNYCLEFKSVNDLAYEDVLIATLLYETLDRKPHKLELVSFHRAKLDDTGGYKLTQEIVDKSMDNFLNYTFCSVDDLALREVIPLPKALRNIPSDAEKKVLYTYMKDKFPMLADDCLYMVNKNIKEIKEHHDSLREFVKSAYKKKYKNE